MTRRKFFSSQQPADQLGPVLRWGLRRAPVLFLYLKSSAALVANERRFAFLRRLDRQSVFVYCCHGGTLSGALFLLTWLVLPYGRPWMAVVGTFAVFFLDAGFCTGLGLALECWCPRTFALLTGGRK